MIDYSSVGFCDRKILGKLGLLRKITRQIGHFWRGGTKVLKIGGTTFACHSGWRYGDALLCALRAATVLPRDCYTDVCRPLTKKWCRTRVTVRVSQYHCGQTLYLSWRCGIPPPPLPPSKIPDKAILAKMTINLIVLIQEVLEGTRTPLGERDPLRACTLQGIRERANNPNCSENFSPLLSTFLTILSKKALFSSTNISQKEHLKTFFLNSLRTFSVGLLALCAFPLYLSSAKEDLFETQAHKVWQGRAAYGPMLVKAIAFRELWKPFSRCSFHGIFLWTELSTDIGLGTSLPRTEPRGPKDWKKFKIPLRDWNFQATNLGLKFSIEIESFKRATQQGPFLWGIIKVGIEIFKRDWIFQSRLKISNLDWKFQAYRLKISRDQSGLIFINRWALWEIFGPFGPENILEIISKSLLGAVLPHLPGEILRAIFLSILVDFSLNLLKV